MNGRPLMDAQISQALRARLPQRAQAGLRERIMVAAETTTQQRALPSVLGALSEADGVVRHRNLLIAAALLLALALASIAGVGAWLVQRDPVTVLSLEPPADSTPFVPPSPSQPAGPSAGPGTGTSTATGNMAIGRGGHTATLLPDGRVLVAGGASEDVAGGALAELYDPGTGIWTATGSLITGRERHTDTLLPDGRVLVAGGLPDEPGPAGQGAGGGELTRAELYDPATGTWTATGNMIAGRYHQTATLLPDGRVLVAGGAHASDDALDSAELYDPATGTWTATGSVITERNHHAAALLRDGRVLVAGGDDRRSGASTAPVEIYDPATGIWTATENWVGQSDPYVTATRLLDGRVLVTGTGGALETGAELYDPATGIWTRTENTVGDRRLFATATLLPDGRVLVAGGSEINPDGAGVSVASAELYDPVSGTWIATVNMATGRWFHTATVLPDGRVLVVGGGSDKPDGPSLTSAELYDPGKGTR